MSAQFLNRIQAGLVRFRSRVEAGDPVARRILFVGAGLLCLGLFVSGLKIISMPPAGGVFLEGSRSDFDDYFQAARRLRGGGDLYNLESLRNRSPEYAVNLRDLQGVGSYLYPPLTAWLLIPLSDLDYEVAAFVFQVCSMLALAGFFIFALRQARRIGLSQEHVWLASVAALLLLYQFLLGNADNGNIGFFLIALGGIGLVLGFESRPIVAFAGGGLLGLATVLKITPAFLVLPLVAGGRVSAVLGMGAGGLAGLGVPALTIGWTRNLELLADWYGFLIANFQKWSIVRPWANNQTLSAAIGKLLIPGADFKQADYGLPLFFRALPSEIVLTRIATGVRLANYFLYALAGLTALRLFFAGAARPGSPLRDEKTTRFLLVATLVSLVASGVSWYHAYSVLLVPVFFRLTQHLAGIAPLRKGEVWTFAVLALFGLGTGAVGSFAREGLAMYSVFVWCMLAALFYHVALCWSGTAREGGS